MLWGLIQTNIVYTFCCSWFGEGLIDSVLLSLVSVGKLRSLAVPERASICHDTRRYLVDAHLVESWTFAGGFPFLSHEDHWAPICSYLRGRLQGFWSEFVDPQRLTISAVVYDRFHRMQLRDSSGAQIVLFST